jgi:hypothetical protein
MSKPKFDPSQKFEKVSAKFDPNAAFESVEDPSMLESGLRGAAQGLTFGLADEAAGALEAAFSDKSYEQARDESRKAFKEAEKANPGTYLAGDIGGSIATSFIPGLGALNAGKGAKLAEVAGKAALQGGLTGFGKSEAEGSELAADALQGAAIGGVLGAGAYGVGKGIEKGAQAWDDIGGKEGLKQVGKAFREGAKDGKELGGLDISNVPGVSQLSQAYYGGKRAISEIADLASTKREMGDVAAALQKTFGPGSSVDLSDNDLLMQKLLEGGIVGEPNRAHELVASKFAQVHGGSADQYLSLLKRSPEELAAAQMFDKITASETLAPQFDDAYKTLRSETGKRFGALSDEARTQFQKVDDTPIRDLQTILAAIDDDTTISATSKNYLREGMKKLGDDFADLEPAEQFDRLVAAKDKLKGGAKWASRNEVPEGAAAVRDASQSVDKYLKALESRKTADSEWTALSRLEDNLFKKIGVVKGGRVQSIDPIKLEKIFSGSSSGRALMKEVAKAEEVLASGKLPADKVQDIQSIIDLLKGYANQANLKREMTAFRYGDAGPSSPAIQRMQAVQGKDSPTTTAVRAPQLFLKMKAEASNAAEGIFGKPFSQLSAQERGVVSKYALWLAQNEGASANDIARKIAQLKADLK